MVSYKEIQASNALINDATAPRVSVFVGGTSGIGKLTIRALVGTGASLRIYLIGRKSAEESSKVFIQVLNTINPKAEIVWLEGEVSLLAETQRLCEIIKAKESRVDLLFMTTGYAPFGTRQETSEGIEMTQSLNCYTRMLFTIHLLPLLNEAEAPRVVSVLAGGLEMNRVDLDDLDLKKPGNFGGMKAHIQNWGMKSMIMEHLANENLHVTFIHSWPGQVNTGNIRRCADPNSLLAWFFWLVFEPVIYLISTSDEEAGQRHLFQCTSAAFGGRGISWSGKAGVNTLLKEENGLFLVNKNCDCTPNAKVMSVLREKAQKTIWEHAQDVFKPYL